jgi:hypothetical protein
MAATACLTAPVTQAADWGYEQLTPADGASYEPYAVGVSADAGTAFVGTLGDPMRGHASDGRSGVYWYGVPRSGAPFDIGPVDVANGPQISTSLEAMAADGSSALLQSATPLIPESSGAALYWFGADGDGQDLNTPEPLPGVHAATADLSRVAFFVTRLDGSGVVALARPGSGAPPEVVSLDDQGDPMPASALGSSWNSNDALLSTGALSADGSSVIFSSPSDADGGADGGADDLYRRILTPGAEQTILLSDANDAGDPDAASAASYRWSSADHERVLWLTREALRAADTDDALDLYLRTGSQAPVLVTAGEPVDGTPTGNLGGLSGDAEWVASSADGDRVLFVSHERLTQDAPAGEARFSLYERDVAEGRTRLVAAPLDDADVDPGFEGRLASLRGRSISTRPVRVTPGGVVFHSVAPLAGDADGEQDVFAWSRGGGLRQLSLPEAGAPASASAPAVLLAINPTPFWTFDPIDGGRAVSADGSRVFFTTAESLTAGDADGGFRDVYAWTAGEGVALVSPSGAAPYDATYVSSSADGTRAVFQTSEGILPGDADPGAIDTYAAILGGGSPPSPPTPPTGPSGPPDPGDAPPTLPPTVPPPSTEPRPSEPPFPPSGPGPGAPPEPGGDATVDARVAERLGRGGMAVLRIDPSARGTVRIRARARLGSRGERRWEPAGRVTRALPGRPVTVRVALSRAARRHLAEHGRLRARFVVRLAPAGDDRPAIRRLTVDLRPGQRR